MKTSLFLVAAFVVLAVAQAPPQPTPSPVDVTVKTCYGPTCDGQCRAETVPAFQCKPSRRNTSDYEALYCLFPGLCMDVEMYSGSNCDGQAFEFIRMGGQCNGDANSPYRWSSWDYLGDFKVLINWNCTSDCLLGCEDQKIVDIRSCFNVGRVSFTLNSVRVCSFINADRYYGNQCYPKQPFSRISVEERTCYTFDDQKYSQHFSIEERV